MQIAVHHYQKRKKSPEELTQKQKALNKFVDDIVYIVGSFGVLVFIPQLIKVWSPGDIAGVSLISWTGLFVASSFWLFYGIIHKAKPIIFINILAVFIQLLIVIGILLHK